MAGRLTRTRNNQQRNRDVRGSEGDDRDIPPTKRPILFVDVDGVISLFGYDPGGAPPGRLITVDGILHCIGFDAGRRLAVLTEHYELVWCTGWEDRANEHLIFLLKMQSELPTLTFEAARFGTAHWKLEAIDAYAGDRPLAWIDDSLDKACARWAAERRKRAPTLLVATDSAWGIEDWHVERLLEWADELERARPPIER